MSIWLSEQEYRLSGAGSVGVTINVAFLREIKTDYGFRDLLNECYWQLRPQSAGQLDAIGEVKRDETVRPAIPQISPQTAAELLNDLRDELETYFALEECYGYLQHSATQNPRVNQDAVSLQQQHEQLFLSLSQIIELTEQIVYREVGSETTLLDVADQFEQFCMELADHEQSEMDLMMRLCNEDFGVGD